MYAFRNYGLLPMVDERQGKITDPLDIFRDHSVSHYDVMREKINSDVISSKSTEASAIILSRADLVNDGGNYQMEFLQTPPNSTNLDYINPSQQIIDSSSLCRNTTDEDKKTDKDEKTDDFAEFRNNNDDDEPMSPSFLPGHDGAPNLENQQPSESDDDIFENLMREANIDQGDSNLDEDIFSDLLKNAQEPKKTNNSNITAEKYEKDDFVDNSSKLTPTKEDSFAQLIKKARNDGGNQ